MKEKRNEYLLNHTTSYFVTAIMLFLSSPFWCFAQVNNNTIAERVHLQPDAEPLYSTTDKSTVEWQCINKKLTERCLIYHNDQWFSYNALHSGKLFLNIADQQCKNKFGVQVLVIEGNPCETSSYKLLHCESFTNQSNTFIELDSLKQGKQYLINIDGFLGDICGFTIQLGTKPNGLPSKAKSLDTLNLTASRVQNSVLLAWEMPPALLDSLDHFEIYRQDINDFKKGVLAKVALRYNALGRATPSYTFSDTLKEHGIYIYTIVGVFEQELKRMLLDEQQVSFTEYRKEKNKKVFTLSVQLEGKKKEDVDFLIMNAITGEVLFKRTCIACSDEKLDFDVTKEVLAGTYQFRIESFHTKTRKQYQYVYVLDEYGNLSKQ